MEESGIMDKMNIPASVRFLQESELKSREKKKKKVERQYCIDLDSENW